ncbi:MAG TPA: hypothetical protein VLL28_10650, partial [Hyphomicrobiaceae bacterium]|nr:hypothetical protein [Hyphomicrobiaceae bacterium]
MPCAVPAATPLRAPDWQVLPETFKGTICLLALVTLSPRPHHVGQGPLCVLHLLDVIGPDVIGPDVIGSDVIGPNVVGPNV